MAKDKKPNQQPTGVAGSKMVKPDEFGVFLGLASWLMSMSADHKNLPFTTLDDRVLPAIILKQFRISRRNGMPMAFISWASVSDEIKKDWKDGKKTKLEMAEWRSGPNLIVVECVSPFAPAAQVKAEFIKEFAQKAAAQQLGN